jgi:hypothetical protein
MKMEEVIIVVPRLKYNGCIQNILKILRGLPTVEITRADLPTKALHLRYDSTQITLRTIKAALATARYPVACEHVIPPFEQAPVS